MPGIQEIAKQHPGLVFGLAGGAVLGVGYLLLKGKGGGQASAFPPQYTLGGTTVGANTNTDPWSIVTGQGGTGHPGPLPGPQPNPQPSPHPGPLPGPQPIPPDPRYHGPPIRDPWGGRGTGPAPVPFPGPGPTPTPGAYPSPYYTPTLGASNGLFSNVLSDITAQNNMSLSG